MVAFWILCGVASFISNLVNAYLFRKEIVVEDIVTGFALSFSGPIGLLISLGYGWCDYIQKYLDVVVYKVDSEED